MPSWQIFLITHLALLSCLSLFAHTSARGQITYLTVDQGLSENNVHCIYQDRRGFMWFGTRSGLNKYDGYSIQKFVSDPQNKKTLSSSYVTAILQPSFEPDHVLWVGTDNGGLNRLNTHTGECERWRADWYNPGALSDNGVISFFEDSRGTVWVGTEHGLNRFNAENQTFTRFFPVPHQPRLALCDRSDNVRAICEDNEGNIWLATEVGLTMLSANASVLKRFLVDSSDTRENGHNSLISLSSSNPVFPNIVYAATITGRVVVFDTKLERFRTFTQLPVPPPSQFAGGPVLKMYPEGDSILLFGFSDGSVARLDIGTKKLTPVEPQPKITRKIETLFADRSGMLWIGSGGDGVRTVRRQHEQFLLYKHSSSRQLLRGDHSVWSLSEGKDGRIWVGTDNGVCVLDEEKKEFRDYTPPLKEFPVRAIVEHESFLWLGTLSGGVMQVDMQTRKISHPVIPPKLPNGGDDKNVYTLHGDGGKTLWVGSNQGGLASIDLATGKFRRFPSSGLRNDPNWWVLSICDDGRSLWLGTWNDGLLRFDKQTHELQHTFEEGKYPVLPETRVICVASDPFDTNILWLGTYGAGLKRFDKTRGLYTHYMERDGLPDNTIYGILADDFGNLWLSTNNGLCRFNPTTGFVRTYTVADGLQSNQFNLGATLKLKDGRMFFGGPQGLNSFRPAENMNPVSPDVLITGFKKFGKRVDFRVPISSLEKVSLSHSDNTITFDFVGLHFQDPARNRYSCMLEGHDTTWNVLNSQREMTYTDLQPGEYAFKVKAANRDGVWSTNPATLFVTISPPFWVAWWFLTGVPFVLGIVAITSLWRRRKRDKELHRRILANVHDRGGAILSTLKVQTEAARQDLKNGSATAERTLEDVTKLIDELSLGVRQATWLQDPTLSSLRDLALHLAGFGGKLFDHLDIAFSLAALPEESENIRLNMRWRENLLCIFQEAMNNVARHARGCTNVVLTFTLEGRLLVASLADDGPGFSKENLTRINGLDNMQRRAALLRGGLTVEPANGIGTRVTLTAKLPLRVVVSMRMRGVYFSQKIAAVF
ncbi:MAG: hypothetical protein KF749_07500 [Bacteroidetes bacterium]|nr:hypothetical protein [Bacteroidota bacterium]MCW5896830.1 hypothetical protein [Bacteroidota bacterium]